MMWSSAFLEEDFVFKKAIDEEEKNGTLQYAFSNTGAGWFETHLGCSSSDFLDRLNKMKEQDETLKGDVDLIIADIESLKKLEVEATVSSISWGEGRLDVIKALGVDDADLKNLRKFAESRKVGLIQACNLWEGADEALKMLDEFKDVWGDEERDAWSQAMERKTEAKRMWKSALHQIDRLTQKEKETLMKSSEILEQEGSLSSRNLQERFSHSHKGLTPAKLSKLLSMYGEEVDIIAGAQRGTFVKMEDNGIIIKDLWPYVAGFLDADGFVRVTERGEPTLGFLSFGTRGKAHCEQLHKAIGSGSLQLNQKTSKDDSLKQHRLLFHSEEDVTHILKNVLPFVKSKKKDVESVLSHMILREIEKEGGALGMKNLKQFGKESELKEVLSQMEKEGKIFMHKDGDIYTHEPKKKGETMKRDGVDEIWSGEA